MIFIMRYWLDRGAYHKMQEPSWRVGLQVQQTPPEGALKESSEPRSKLPGGRPDQQCVVGWGWWGYSDWCHNTRCENGCLVLETCCWGVGLNQYLLMEMQGARAPTRRLTVGSLMGAQGVSNTKHECFLLHRGCLKAGRDMHDLSQYIMNAWTAGRLGAPHCCLERDALHKPLAGVFE